MELKAVIELSDNSHIIIAQDGKGGKVAKYHTNEIGYDVYKDAQNFIKGKTIDYFEEEFDTLPQAIYEITKTYWAERMMFWYY